MNIIVKTLRLIKFLEIAASSVAGATLFLIMVLVCIDVVRRYFFNSPLIWSYDVISLYLMGVIFFLALSDTLRRDHHVKIDIFFARFSKRSQLFWTALGWSLSSVFFTLVFILVGQSAYSRWQSDDVVGGDIPWPTWISAAIATFGLILICVRLVLGTVVYVIALTTKDFASVSDVQARMPVELED